MPDLEPTLHELADAYRIATEYWDWQGRHVSVTRDTIVAVLGALGVDASTPEAAAAALDEHHRRPWTQMLPAVSRRSRAPRRSGAGTHAARRSGRGLARAGDRRSAATTWCSWRTRPRRGRSTAGWSVRPAVEIPADLPLGYHTLHARSGEREATMPVIITPAWLGVPGPDGRPAGLGPGRPALQRAVPAVLGRRRPERPGGPRGLVGHRARRRLRPGQPAARRGAAGADGALALPADAAGASPTRSICASSEFPSTPPSTPSSGTRWTGCGAGSERSWPEQP